MLRAVRTVRTRVIILLMAVALPMLAVSAVSAVMLWLSARDAIEGELSSRARAAAGVAEREIQAAQSLLQALATSPALDAGDLESFHRQITATPQPDGTRVALIDRFGQLLISSVIPFGEPLPKRKDLATVERVFATGQPTVSNLFEASLRLPSAGSDKSIAVDVPVTRHGQVIYDLSMAFPSTALARQLAEVTPPGDQGVTMLLDGRRVIVARFPGNHLYAGREVMPEVVQAIARMGTRGTFRSREIDGQPLLVSFVRLTGADWVAAAAIRDTFVDARLSKPLLAVLGGGGLLVALGLAAASYQGRRIARAIAMLSKVPAAIPDDFPEVAAVARSLAEAQAQRRRAEAALRERDTRLRLALEAASLGTWERNLATGRSTWDAALAVMLGFPPEAAPEIGDRWAELVHPQDLDRLLRAVQVATDTGQPFTAECRMRGGDGVERIMMTHAIVVPPGRLVGVAYDVTELRAADVSARTALAELNAIYESAPVGLCVLDTELRWVRINACLAEMNGYPVEAHIGRRLRDLLPSVADATEDLFRRVIDTGVAARDVELSGETPARPGETRWWNDDVLPVRDASGRVIGINLVVQEVTEKRAIQRALAESEARFRAITDAMPQIAWAAGPDGQTEYQNQRALDLIGMTLEQVQRAGWGSLLHPDDAETVWPAWRHSLATGEPYEAEFRIRMADGGYRWMLTRALPLRDPATGAITRWFGTSTDIEETVLAREALARSHEELERLVAERTRDLEATQARLALAQRLEALGQLAGGIAHDFNNVLQLIQGRGAMLEAQPGDSAAVRRHARLILEAVARGANITRRLLSFARRGDLRSESVDPASLLTGMRDILAHTLGDGIEVRVEAAAGLAPLWADRGQLETILVNLATNGRDAMGSIGTLTMAAAAETVREEDRHSHPGLLKAGRYVRISVTDTGTGMDAATLARASEPFFSTKPSGQGTGLGLPIARAFAEQSGGGLHIESAPGAGTTVRLWLPVADKDRPSAGSQDKTAIAATRDAGRRILVIDDDYRVREVLAEQMEAIGYTVLAAESAAEALALLDSGDPVELVVSDLSMPGMDGMTLVREARQRRPGLPAILLTGFATNTTHLAVEGARGGAFSMVCKPIDAERLGERVTALLHEKDGV